MYCNDFSCNELHLYIAVCRASCFTEASQCSMVVTHIGVSHMETILWHIFGNYNKMPSPSCTLNSVEQVRQTFSQGGLVRDNPVLSGGLD